jgi:hypothetical protein
MRQAKTFLAAAVVAVTALAIGASPASAAFGIEAFDVTFTNEGGSPVTQAGSHPFQMTSSLEFKKLDPLHPDEEFKDLTVEQIAGLVADAGAVPRCSTVDFLTFINAGVASQCPDSTALGANATRTTITKSFAPAFNLDPPPGVVLKLGFIVVNTPITIEVGLKDAPPYNGRAALTNIPQTVGVLDSVLTLWGNPADPAHDPYRGNCVSNVNQVIPPVIEANYPEPPSYGDCTTNSPEEPFLTLPSSCNGPQETTYEATSWQGSKDKGGVPTHDDSVPSNPLGMTGCAKLGFSPEVDSKATTDSAETSTGLDFSIDFHDEGLTSPKGLAQSTIKDTVVTLPEGVTVNPSIAEGLGVCGPADLGRETLKALPGQGCPNASKIGTVHVETPLLDEAVEGSVFLAKQDDPATSAKGAENPFDSLLAFYIVLKHPGLGVLVKLPALVEPDPVTGQLVTTVEDTPQLPFSHFEFHFREGQRAPLVSPPACGTYTTKAELTPWARPSEVLTTTSDFQITRGIGGGACPPGGVPPFKPGFEAGSINNNAGSYSPFYMRLTRADGEQDMTKFSSVLPPGVLGKLAGVSKCPDAAVDVAKAKTGRQELASPSCPASSRIGRTLAGAGVGGSLAYVPGQIYLAGPYKGDPLSVIAVTPAVAGPFDAGTVVVRLALTLNPRTAEVEVDGASSDPIPHILKGIPLKVRDLRVYVDRPNFTLNPTSCDPSSVKATLFGGYLDLFSPADDAPVGLSSRYQAANCLSLGFKPKLDFKLKGGTKRGGHPGLLATYAPRAGDANVEGLVVRLPRSAFLDQAHIRTICTRVQFAADACPAGAQYGFIKAFTPLLDEPLEGPVWLRSSTHKLPDLVFDLHGLVDIEVATRIDSAKGGIRATLEDLPDAPLSKVLLRMQGGKKGLIVNSRNLCGAKSRAEAQMSGQNGKQLTSKPVMRAECGGGRKGKRAARSQP